MKLIELKQGINSQPKFYYFHILTRKQGAGPGSIKKLLKGYGVAKNGFGLPTTYIFRKSKKVPYVLNVRVLLFATGLLVQS